MMTDDNLNNTKFVPPPLPNKKADESNIGKNDDAGFVPPPLPSSIGQNATQTTQECSPQKDSLPETEKTKSGKNIFLVFLALCIVGCVVFAFLRGNAKNELGKESQEQSSTIDMGSVGNKIAIGDTIAYVAGENKILVPYDFCGDYWSCCNEVLSKSLEGCENPRLPADETDALPEEVTMEIISFYDDVGGFWTSIEADHASIEVVGAEPESIHYAGIMTNYFDVGNDGMAHAVWGYCLDATNDEATMGLLALYDVTDEFEFTDVEDTADPTYSTDYKTQQELLEADTNAEGNYGTISMNDVLLSDLGSTFAEMREKYGEVIQLDNWDGGTWFKFENAPDVAYFFVFEGQTCLSCHYDENGGFVVDEMPNDAAECYYLMASAHQIFTGIGNSVPIDYLAQSLEETEEWDGNVFADLTQSYYTSFMYGGSYLISINQQEEGRISNTDVVDVIDIFVGGRDFAAA